jgi:hypothetical protein
VSERKKDYDGIYGSYLGKDDDVRCRVPVRGGFSGAETGDRFGQRTITNEAPSPITLILNWKPK